MTSLTTVAFLFFVFHFGNRLGDRRVSHCQIIAFFEDSSVFRNAVIQSSVFWVCTVNYSLSFVRCSRVLIGFSCFAYSKTFTAPSATLMTSSESDLLATTGTLSGTACVWTGFTMSHPKGTFPKVQSSRTPAHKSYISGTTLLGLQSAPETSRSRILFVMCSAWRERPRSETTCTHLRSELQERESEKALRINLQLLQLSRHTLLYLFNHTCLWTINNFNRAHKCSAPLDPAIQRTVTNLGAYIYVRGLSSSLGKKL